MAKETGKPTTLVIPQLVQIRRVDPEWQTVSKELQYDFSPVGRRFYRDPRISSAYGGAFSLEFDSSFDSPTASRVGR